MMVTSYFGYVDWTTAGVPFYVGIGNEDRLRNYVRNRKHANVSSKHGRIRVIEFASNDWKEMCSWEIATIWMLKTHHLESESGLGCNFTFGGDGKRGFVPSAESRERMKASALRRATPEANMRISATLKGRRPTDEERRKISAGLIGKKRRPFTDEHRRNISLGTRAGMARKKHVNE